MGLRAVRIMVDLGRCVGHARCYALAPEWFDLDDETGISSAKVGDVPLRLEASVLAATNGCPERAIEIIS